VADKPSEQAAAPKKVGAGTKYMDLVEYLKICSTNSKFDGVGRNYPPVPLLNEKNGSFFSFISLRRAATPSCGLRRPSSLSAPAPKLPARRHRARPPIPARPRAPAPAR
jgi:hypothetical protein